MVNHASATHSSRAGWRYREGNSSFSGPTPQSLGVCAAFFCDQARSNWDSVTSATQFHCPKLYREPSSWRSWSDNVDENINPRFFLFRSFFWSSIVKEKMFQKFIHIDLSKVVLTRAVGCSRLSVSEHFTLIFELRSADCRESMPLLSSKTPRKNSSCKCNVSCFCERLPDVRSHLRPRWSRRTIDHNASQSTKTAWRTRSGRLVELALRSCSDRWDSTVDSWTLLLFWAFIHFEGNWACLLATGSHRYRGQSA